MPNEHRVLTHVRATLGPPERRVYRVLGQARSTQRSREIARDGDEALVRRIHELVRQQEFGAGQLWRFANVEELLNAVHQFRQTYNERWILQRHDYLTPSAVRAKLLDRATAA